ncbi:MAG: protein-L-isoaspartate(D-aspartate) O-methyltransferase [Spirochaetota bacterium]
MELSEQYRERMVEEQIAARGITDGRVLRAFKLVPRHLFVPEVDPATAYADSPLSIGSGQTISQPYIVAKTCELAGLSGTEKVLEIGTGSGYAAAVLSLIAEEVYTIERLEGLHIRAKSILQKLGYDSVVCIHGDGYEGYEQEAPYDAILLSAAPKDIPDELLRQLKVGGRMVGPIGTGEQYLLRIIRTESGYDQSTHGAVRFVPMR